MIPYGSWSCCHHNWSEERQQPRKLLNAGNRPKYQSELIQDSRSITKEAPKITFKRIEFSCCVNLTSAMLLHLYDFILCPFWCMPSLRTLCIPRFLLGFTFCPLCHAASLLAVFSITLSTSILVSSLFISVPVLCCCHILICPKPGRNMLNARHFNNYSPTHKCFHTPRKS